MMTTMILSVPSTPHPTHPASRRAPLGTELDRPLGAAAGSMESGGHGGSGRRQPGDPRKQALGARDAAVRQGEGPCLPTHGLAAPGGGQGPPARCWERGRTSAPLGRPGPTPRRGGLGASVSASLGTRGPGAPDGNWGRAIRQKGSACNRVRNGAPRNPSCPAGSLLARADSAMENPDLGARLRPEVPTRSSPPPTSPAGSRQA